MSETTQAEGQAQLLALVDGKSDEEINAAIKEAGYPALLGPIFAAMEQNFLPEKNAGRDAVIQYDLGTPDGVEKWQLLVASGKLTTVARVEKAPNLTITMTVPDFLRLLARRLDGMQAFATGKLKLSGDIMLAQVMLGWFAQ